VPCPSLAWAGLFCGTEFADPAEAEKRAKAIIQAATHFKDPKVLLEVSEDLARGYEGAGRVVAG
jgi:pyridoxal 5'-phosphate synthase pdxS subunit